MNELPVHTVAIANGDTYIRLPDGWYPAGPWPTTMGNEPTPTHNNDNDLWCDDPNTEIVSIPWIFRLTRTQAHALINTQQPRRPGTYGGGPE